MVRCLALLEDESALAKTVRTVQASAGRAGPGTLCRPDRAGDQDLWSSRKNGSPASGPPSRTSCSEIIQRLAGRVRVLEERYTRPLPKLEEDVATFSAKVEGHLKRMGFSL